MYRNSLNTKAERLAAREAILTAARTRGATVTHHAEADTVSVVHQRADHCTLTLYNGTAYNPTAHYAFRTMEALEAGLGTYLQNRTARLAHKAERRKARPLSDHAATAAAIRRRLCETFPGIKFSVRSESFANGDSISVSWTDGPLAHLVDAIVGQYQCGSFDSMADCYEYRAIDSSLGCPGVKYVSTRRQLSPARKSEIEQAARAAHGGELPLNLWGREFCHAKYEAEHLELWAEESREEGEPQQAVAEESARKEECPHALLDDEPLALVDPTPNELAAFLNAFHGTTQGKPAGSPPCNIVDLAAYRAARLP